MIEFDETTVASMGEAIDVFLDDDGILSRFDVDPDSSVAELVCLKLEQMMYPWKTESTVAIDMFDDNHRILTGFVEDSYSTSMTELPADEFLPMINQIYNLLLEKTKLIPSCKVDNNRFCLSVHFRCVEEKIWRGHIEDVRSVLADYPGLRLTQGRKWVQVSVVLPEKVMKQMTFLPPVMGAGAYSPRRKAVANANYKKLMCIVDQLNKTCKASSCLESMKEPSLTNLSAESDSERKCPSASSKFDEKKADNVSFYPIVEDPGSAVMTESCVHDSDVVQEDVMIQMPIPPPAMAAGSYQPPRSSVSIADYNKLVCLVDQLSKSYNASSSSESMKQSSPTYLSADSDWKRKCPSAFSKFDKKKADYVSFSPIVEDPSSAVMTESCVHVSDVVPEEVMIQMPIPPPAMAARSYQPPRSSVSIADYKKLMCLVDQLSKAYNASFCTESMKQSAIGKFDEITAASTGQKIVVFDDYNGSLSPIVIYFLNYVGPSYATVMTIAILFLIPIIDILFLIPIIASIFYLLGLHYAAPPPPPLQDTTLGTWPNYAPRVAFTDCCSICLVDFDDEEEEGEDNPLRILPDCGHVFHAMCVDRWLRLNPTCPICRAWAG